MSVRVGIEAVPVLILEDAELKAYKLDDGWYAPCGCSYEPLCDQVFYDSLWEKSGGSVLT